MIHINQELASLKSRLYDLSRRNPLVHIASEQLYFPAFSTLETGIKIANKAQALQREYGLETSLEIGAFLRWKKNENDDYYTSPILYRSCQIKQKRRESKTIELTSEELAWTTNPVLQLIFRLEFGITLGDSYSSSEDLFKELRIEFPSLSFTNEFLNSEKWELIESRAAGVFNYKKLGLTRDYNLISKNAKHKALEELLEGKSSDSREDCNLPTVFLRELDHTQQTALKQCIQSNHIVQGPPGTGKSHLLTVLIKTLLHQNKKVLFVSEKRSALDVVYNRLKQEKLSAPIAYFGNGSEDKKQFYHELKSEWEATLQGEYHIDQLSSNSKYVEDQEPLYPKIFKRVFDSTVSIHELEKELLDTGYSLPELYSKTEVPPHHEWKNAYSDLVNLEVLVQQKFDAAHLAQASFIGLNPGVFSEHEPMVNLALKLEQLSRHLASLRGLATRYNIPENLNDISRYAIAASILNMVNRNQFDLIQTDHRKYKIFNTLAKKFRLLKNRLIQLQQINEIWGSKPSLGEVIRLIEQNKTSSRPKSILSVLKRNAAKDLAYFDSLPPDLTKEEKLTFLENLREEYKIASELEEIRIKLIHDLNLVNPDTEIDHILHVRSKLERVSHNEYIFLLEAENSLDIIRDFAAAHSDYNKVHGLVQFIFNSDVSRDFSALEEQIRLILQDLDDLDWWSSEIKKFLLLPDTVRRFIAHHQVPVVKMHALVLAEQIRKYSKLFPGLQGMNGHQIKATYRQYHARQKQQSEEAVRQIQLYSKRTIKQYQKLAETASSKLQPEEKKLKERFKKSRRLLLHEFGKTRQHKPVRALMDEMHEFLLQTKPVWIMNPLSVTELLPCVAELFDYVVFDEASQIPLEDAVPSIYRSKQVVVVGDSKQMPPTQFFTSAESSLSLLDKSETSWSSSMLKIYYRGTNPDLISFSNRRFYDHELMFFPPTSMEEPITCLRVDGTFEDGSNKNEAAEVARYYKKLVDIGETDVAIISLSLEQQNEIKRQMTYAGIELHPNSVLSNLENIQGAEKKIVLISIGYAKNAEGKFVQNFGPINQEKGSNRLNVLFTRAIEKMIVFTSISPSDFKTTDNLGIITLKEFLKHASKPAHAAKQADQSQLTKFILNYLAKEGNIFHTFSQEEGYLFDAISNEKSDRLLIVDPGLNDHESINFSLMLQNLEARFKKFKLVTSHEILEQPEASMREISEFFEYYFP